MPHPFADKLFVFIGSPVRCSRQAARDMLAAIGGVTEDRFSVYTHYAVAFSGAESTKLYEKASERDYYGHTVLLDEEQFFNVLEGKVEPPARKKPPLKPNTFIIPAKDEQALEREYERAISDAVSRKRLSNMAKHGVPMPDGGRLKADLRPLDMAVRFEKYMEDEAERFRGKLCVTLETLKSKPINEKAIEKGVALWKGGHVEYQARGEAEYWAQVTDKGEMRGVILQFSRDGADLSSYQCVCNPSLRSGLICKHIVAAVLAIQGRIAETGVTLGKTAAASVTVDKTNTAKAVGSGDLDVFATPMMIALMERAACKVLTGALEAGQTSVGTSISIDHTAASPIGAVITATATIVSVSGRKVEFELSASDENRAIGSGRHTRMIVDAKRFMERTGKVM